ncbi:MAG TPA: methylated-DNA--[protein]-cysteine S-methyltransferase [Gemmatimonadaceae bacterium]|nr:methylated-DNA--[protein]-cysteine S-methyltransferase [Gemmatimonadaceae bacterium]
MTTTADYARIERAIRYLEEHRRANPSLAEVAHAVGLSEHHFQRLFTRWAGISPKRFLQFQSAAHARRLLRDSRSVLDATYEAGLSGPGRLHDLVVHVEAATPGEWRSGGDGVRIAWGVHPSPFGDVLIAATPRGVCRMAFLAAGGADAVLAELADEWPRAALAPDEGTTAPFAARVFGGWRHGVAAQPEPLSVVVKGTNLQLKVWEALLRVPPGAVTTYEALAAGAGAPSAVRAVASAVARNPVAYLIPCHRVIRKTGAFGEYRWGAARKRAMLLWESCRADEGLPAAS